MDLFRTPFEILGDRGNNRFGRRNDGTDRLSVPKRVFGSLSDVAMGNRVAFREYGPSGEAVDFYGLEQFVTTPWKDRPLTVVDNHNYALPFWLEAYHDGLFAKGATLVHVDMHSDLWPNGNVLDLSRTADAAYVEDFTNLRTEVGNYVAPALDCGLFGRFVKIEGETELDNELSALAAGEYHASSMFRDNGGAGFVLNLDLDFFAPDLDYVPLEKKIRLIRRFAEISSAITVATSPCFVDQDLALRRMFEIFEG